MKIIFKILACLSISWTLNAQNPILVHSPSGQIKLHFFLDNGTPRYQVSYRDKIIIHQSELGFSLNRPELDIKQFKLVRHDTTTFAGNWTPIWGEVSIIRNEYHQLRAELVSMGNPAIEISILFRVFNDGVGFRYEFPKQKNLAHFIIGEEATQFNLSHDYTAFWIPGDYDTNEYVYNTTSLSQIDALKAAGKEKDIAVQSLIGPAAVQTPLMLKGDDSIYVNIHEAALINYPVMNLILEKESFTFTTHLVPDAVGNKGYLQTPAKTPWRTIIITDNAKEILSSKTILNLNEPTKIGDTDWIRPQKFIGVWWEMHVGKGSWDLASGKHAANTENVKKYLDFASKYGFDGVLVEGWNQGWEDWFGNWKEDVFDFVSPYPDYDMDELSEYASDRKIKLIMHHETSGSATNYERHLDTAFRYMVSNGINTVKTGYVGKIIPRGEHHDGQWMNNHYVRVVEKAAEYKIMVEAHEPSHPTGLHRTYPNWLANEAARGNEFNNAPTLGIPPEHQTILPFTRLMGGPMDFTPGLFHFKLNQFDPSRTTIVSTTLCKQLALYITMYSPLQMAGDLPENYEKHLDAFQFIIDVPVDWDDTKILEAEPGDYVAIARKEKGKNNWYVGGITDENSRTCDLSFDFLDPDHSYEMTIYQDGPDAHWQTHPESYLIEKKEITHRNKMTIRLAEGGGFAISIKEKK